MNITGNFYIITDEGVRKLRMKEASKSCELDPILASIIKQCLEPMISPATDTCIVNASLI